MASRLSKITHAQGLARLNREMGYTTLLIRINTLHNADSSLSLAGVRVGQIRHCHTGNGLFMLHVVDADGCTIGCLHPESATVLRELH